MGVAPPSRPTDMSEVLDRKMPGLHDGNGGHNTVLVGLMSAGDLEAYWRMKTTGTGLLDHLPDHSDRLFLPYFLFLCLPCLDPYHLLYCLVWLPLEAGFEP